MELKKRERRARVPVRGDKTKTNSLVKTNGKAGSINKSVVILAQEIKITRLLANNDKKVRDKAFKRLRKWLTARSQNSFESLTEFTKKDFVTLWKGLFFCMWMSDKMLVQEDLAESISKLVHCFEAKYTIVLYTKCALSTLAKEWFGIDQYRLDKFSMLVRRILRQTFVVCKNRSWNMEWVTETSEIFKDLFLSSKSVLGFNLHLTEIYLEELAKVSGGNLPKDVVHQFIEPFVVYLSAAKDERQMKHIIRHVFRYLIFQSDVGLDYMDKFEAWKSAGFPCTHVDGMQKVEIIDEDESSDNESEQLSETKMQSEAKKPLDPRAGRVNVSLPQIPFDPVKIIELLQQYRLSLIWQTTSKSRRHIARLIAEFQSLSEERMPIGFHRIKRSQKGDMDMNKAALRLIQFDKDLYSDETSKKRKRNTELTKTAASVNAKVDTSTITNCQNTSTNVVFSKKRKKDATVDKLDDTLEIAENKKMLKTKSRNATKKIKLIPAHDADVDSQLENKKAKKSPRQCVQLSKGIQSTLSSDIPKKKNSKKLKKSDDKSTTKTLSKNNVAQKNAEVTPLKTKSSQVKGQTVANNFSARKKKVVFGLSRNTEQHTSEYFQQIRRSPAIPYDANRKPLAGVLKANPIPSPLNPFYKK